MVISATIAANTLRAPRSPTRPRADSTTDDPNAANNSSEVTITVATLADVSITKSGPVATAGTSLTYTLTVSNAGPSDAQSVLVSDALPTELSNAQFCTYAAPMIDCLATTTWSGSTSWSSLPAGATTKVKSQRRRAGRRGRRQRAVQLRHGRLIDRR